MTPHRMRAYADQSWAYEHFAPDGRLHLVCPQCHALVLLFETLPSSARSNIARSRHSDPVAAMVMLSQISGCDARQAKANILHMRDADSRCHHCKHLVPRGALLCGQCMSVNLDW